MIWTVDVHMAPFPIMFYPVKKLVLYRVRRREYLYQSICTLTRGKAYNAHNHIEICFYCLYLSERIGVMIIIKRLSNIVRRKLELKI